MYYKLNTAGHTEKGILNDNCHLKYHEYRHIVFNSTANTEIINITTNV